MRGGLHVFARGASETFGTFEPAYRQMMAELRVSRYAGDRIIAHRMALNVDIHGYYSYAFETVEKSDSGRLIHEFLALPMTRLFLYGQANRTLSYLPILRASAMHVAEISSSAHFLFYDNPADTFETAGEFVHTTRL